MIASCTWPPAPAVTLRVIGALHLYTTQVQQVSDLTRRRAKALQCHGRQVGSLGMPLEREQARMVDELKAAGVDHQTLAAVAPFKIGHHPLEQRRRERVDLTVKGVVGAVCGMQTERRSMAVAVRMRCRDLVQSLARQDRAVTGTQKRQRSTEHVPVDELLAAQER